MNEELFIYLATGLFIFLWVASYSLREIPHIWSKSTTYRLKLYWMKNSKWWTDSSPRSDSFIRNLTGINMFDDAYHFFGNLPRVVLSIMAGLLVHWGVGVVMFFFWFIGREFVMKNMVGKK